MRFFKTIFQTTDANTADKLREKQLHNAQHMELEHQAAADYHQAMANMYRDRQKRLGAAAAQKAGV